MARSNAARKAPKGVQHRLDNGRNKASAAEPETNGTRRNTWSPNPSRLNRQSRQPEESGRAWRTAWTCFAVTAAATTIIDFQGRILAETHKPKAGPD